MSEKLKVPKKDAAKRIKGCLDKFIHQPVSKKLVDALIRRGDIERQIEEEKKSCFRTKPFESSRVVN